VKPYVKIDFEKTNIAKALGTKHFQTLSNSQNLI